MSRLASRRDITDREIQAAKAGNADRWLVCRSRHGKGQLLLRVTTSGRKTFYFRQSLGGGARDTILIGDYHADRDRGGTFTLEQARDRFDEYIALLNSGVRSLREHFKANDDLHDAEKAAREAESARLAAETERRRKFNLTALLDGYAAHLAKAKRQSAKDVANLIKIHVNDVFPELSAKPANEVRPGDLRIVLARLIEAGKGRTAGKLRSYIRAAYSLAIKAENDPTAPAALMGFEIETNPADAVPSLKQFSRRGERVLTADELRQYMQAVDRISGEQVRAALMLSLLLGGQRPQQLIRASAQDLDLEAETITIRDGKGARAQARLHVLPLTNKTRGLFEVLLAQNGSAPSLFSTDGATVPRLETLSNAVTGISVALVASKAIRTPFQQRDLRRTCETMLAALGVSKDIRAQLLSHGLSGVQTANYDRHDYMAEKRQALNVWQARLAEIAAGRKAPAKVVAAGFRRPRQAS